MTDQHADRTRGALAASLCYTLWGLVPIYWKHLASINAVELIAHRHLLSLIFVGTILAIQGRLADAAAELKSPRAIGINLLSATMLTANWTIYVWGVNNGHVIECSLGYFLVPLVNVATGRFVLHEHLRRLQWTAIALATIGVGILIYQLGHPPWIALGEAASWGVYSYMRKKSPLAPVVGLTVETFVLAPVAVAFLLWQQHTGAGALGRVDARLHAYLLSAGVITAIPLLLFAYAAQRIRLSTIGLLQYISPTVQFALAVSVFHEAFTRDKLISFGLIWAAVGLYVYDNVMSQKRSAAKP